MEPITLCGAVILVFGLWIEFEPKIKAAVKAVRSTTLFTEATKVPRPACVEKMPICFAKTTHIQI